MKRITLRSPDYSHQFDIRNGSLTRPFTWWEFYPSWEAMQELHELGIRFASGVKLDEVLRAVGSHAALWIGDYQGRVAPMDVQPEGWTFPNGDPLPQEWWWQWYPNEDASKKATDFLNTNIVESWSRNSPLKFGIPFQVQRSLKKIQSVDAIPIQRLPGITKHNTPWIFEF